MSKPERVVLTGAGGFVGRHLSAALNESGHDVIAVQRKGGRRPPPGVHSAPVSTHPSVDELAAIISREHTQVLFHLAGTTGGGNTRLLHQANVAYAGRVLDAAARVGSACTVVLIGSAAEYGPPLRADGVVSENDPCHPVSAYGRSKLAQTRLGLAAAASGLPVVVARLFNPVGEESPVASAVGSFVRQIADMAPDGGRLTTGPLGAIRDLTDIRATVQVLALLPGLGDAAGRIVNVCSGVGTPMSRVVERLIALAPFPVRHIIDTARGGTSAVDVVVGDPSRLTALGLHVGPIDLDPLLDRMLQAVGIRRAAVP